MDQRLFENYRGFGFRNERVVYAEADSPQAIYQKNAITFRDELIINYLKLRGVKSLVDLGCDFGSLLSIAKKTKLERWASI